MSFPHIDEGANFPLWKSTSLPIVNAIETLSYVVSDGNTHRRNRRRKRPPIALLFQGPREDGFPGFGTLIQNRTASREPIESPARLPPHSSCSWVVTIGASPFSRSLNTPLQRPPLPQLKLPQQGCRKSSALIPELSWMD